MNLPKLKHPTSQSNHLTLTPYPIELFGDVDWDVLDHRQVKTRRAKPAPRCRPRLALSAVCRKSPR